MQTKDENVKSLDSYRRSNVDARKEAIRRLALEVAQREHDQLIAAASVAITDEGIIRTAIVGVEPEQATALIAGLKVLEERLRELASCAGRGVIRAFAASAAVLSIGVVDAAVWEAEAKPCDTRCRMERSG